MEFKENQFEQIKGSLERDERVRARGCRMESRREVILACIGSSVRVLTNKDVATFS